MVDVLELGGARVLVTGAGVTGPSVVRTLLTEGAHVTVTDASADRVAKLAADFPEIDTTIGATTPPAGTELIVTTPGWRPTAPIFGTGVDVIGDVELAWLLCQRLPSPPAWLVVTGTNGKTTTVGMLERMLLAAGLDAVACGNIGLPVLDALHHPVLAVELSSFQLYWAPSVRPTAGAVLNIAQDHLDWHGDMTAYAAAKARALRGDVAIAGVEDPLVASLLADSTAPRKIGVRLTEPGSGELGVHAGRLVDRAFADAEELADVAGIAPAGPPGVFDALVAAALARSHGVPADAVAAGLAAFEPGEHRSVDVAEIDGVRYVNDSKATNPHAAAAALRAHRRVVWIAGGLLKGAAVDELVVEAAERLVGTVLLGADQADRDVFAGALARHAPDVPVHTVSAGDDDPMSVMSQAVRAARALARPGDVVLLAPAAASMDQFTDYRQRGCAFAAAVRALVPGHG